MCVDLLDSALQKLNQYSEEYKVKEVIQTEKVDIGNYDMKPNNFDFIVAVSSLEHVQPEEVLKKLFNE